MARSTKKRPVRTKRVNPVMRDDLEDLIREQIERDPEFAKVLEEAEERMRRLRELATARKAAGLTQTVVAARMETSASAVARLERGEMNPTLATLQRYAGAIGKTLDWRLV